MQKRLFISLMLALFITSCAPPPQPGEPVTHATACDVANNDKRVSLEGYPRLRGLLSFVSDDFAVDFFEQPQGGGDPISVYLTVGTGPNQVENLPDNYTDDDLRIHTNTNEVVTTDTRIRAHGTLSVSEPEPGNVVCFITAVDLIEAAPAGN